MYRFSLSAVSTEAAHASVHDLNDTEYRLQQSQTQQDGEQHDVPENHIVRKVTFGPSILIHQVTSAVPVPARQKKERKSLRRASSSGHTINCNLSDIKFTLKG